VPPIHSTTEDDVGEGADKRLFIVDWFCWSRSGKTCNMDLQRKRNGHNAEPHNILYSSAAKGLLQRVTWPWLGVACWSDKPS